MHSMKNRLNKNNQINSEDNSNPLDGVSNMSDAMLVLAVGIMLALVINWKIDIKEAYNGQEQKETVEDSKLQEFDSNDLVKNDSVSIGDIESNYVKSGTVYTDTVTGKTYIVVD